MILKKTFGKANSSSKLALYSHMAYAEKQKENKMAFKIDAEDLKKSQKCPVGMHIATLTEVGKPYFNDKQTEIQQCFFETEKGYTTPYWFNNKMVSSILEFVQAADKVTFDAATMAEMDIELSDYIGKKVAISVSHIKDKNGKLQSQIDNFFNSEAVPF